MKRIVQAAAFIALTGPLLAAQAADKTPARQSFEPEMVKINPGSFMMGSNVESDYKAGPVHQVRIGYAFEMSKTEITQAEWLAVMGENPSGFTKCGEDCPVEQVSWEDVMRYLKRLNKKSGKEYRLPSEAEWEYACRAGSNDTYCGGNDAGKVAWHKENSGNESSPVASKKPNAWGLYDMSGNVYEWVQDRWHDGFDGAPADGSAWEGGAKYENIRNVRGGSWESELKHVTAAKHGNMYVTDKEKWLGFRVVRTLP